LTRSFIKPLEGCSRWGALRGSPITIVVPGGRVAYSDLPRLTIGFHPSGPRSKLLCVGAGRRQMTTLWKRSVPAD